MAKHTHISKPLITVAIVGGGSLLGKELREVVETASIPAKIKLIGAEDVTVLTAQGGEPSFMAPMRAEELTEAKVVVLCGSLDSSRKAYEMAANLKSAPIFVDASGALEDNPAARLRAPMAETAKPEAAGLHIVAHPAAIALALFLRRVRESGPIRSCVVVAFEPASERGQAGLDELQQQTVGLLSFKKLKKEIFDTQVSFNLVPRYGEDAPRKLEDVEANIERHLASLLSTTNNVPMPSLRLVQAPVFHGYSFSVWVEFEDNPGVESIANALGAKNVEVRVKDEEAPSNVGVTGQSGISVGAIATDRNNPRACWFWVVADNLRIMADNAVEVMREFVG